MTKSIALLIGITYSRGDFLLTDLRSLESTAKTAIFPFCLQGTTLISSIITFVHPGKARPDILAMQRQPANTLKKTFQNFTIHSIHSSTSDARSSWSQITNVLHRPPLQQTTHSQKTETSPLWTRHFSRFPHPNSQQYRPLSFRLIFSANN